MIREKREITPENMINYYFETLSYTKKQSHRNYLIHMIGYHCGSLPSPKKKITDTLK